MLLKLAHSLALGQCFMDNCLLFSHSSGVLQYLAYCPNSVALSKPSSVWGNAGRLFHPQGVHLLKTSSPKISSRANFTVSTPILHSDLRCAYLYNTLHICCRFSLLTSHEGISTNLVPNFGIGSGGIGEFTCIGGVPCST